MNEELQLKLQAYADGELSSREAGEVAEFLARDADARALVVELKNTRSALDVYAMELRLPESREFYWSKIERAIQRLEESETPRPETSVFAAWRRLLAPAMALAALVIALFVVLPQFRAPHEVESQASEFALTDSDAFTYHDYANGTTLVWLGYPAENDFTESYSEDTLD